MEAREIVEQLKNLRGIRADKNFVKRTKKEIFGERVSPFLLFPIFSATLALLAVAFSYYFFAHPKTIVQNQPQQTSSQNVIQNQPSSEISKPSLEKPKKNLVKNKVSKESVKRVIESLSQAEELEKTLGAKVASSSEDDFVEEEYAQKLAKLLISETEKLGKFELSGKMKKAFEEKDYQKVIDLYLQNQVENQTNSAQE